MLPQHLVIKRGGITVAQLTGCRPGGDMFWVACRCYEQPGFEAVASIFRQIEAIPYLSQQQFDKQFDALTKQISAMEIVLENPLTGEQWPHFLLSFFDNNVVEIRY